MKDPILGRYTGELQTIPIASIMIQANDPRINGLNNEHINELREAIESGEKLPPPIVLPNNENSTYAFSAIAGRHTMQAHAAAGKENITAFLITDKMAADEVEALAYAENAPLPKLSLTRSEHLHFVKRLYSQYGYTTTEVKKRLKDFKIPIKTIDQLTADASSYFTIQLARQAVRISQSKKIPVSQAVLQLDFPDCTRHKTVLKKAHALKGDPSESDLSLMQTMAGTVDEWYRRCDQWNRRQNINLVEKAEFRPSDEMIEVYNKMITNYKRLGKWLEQQKEKLENQQV